jgi:periplasmic protein TonB
MYDYAIQSPEASPLRWLYIVPMAATTTFGLLLLMFKLGYTADVVMVDEPEWIIPDAVWEEPKPIEVIKKPPAKPDEPQVTPPKPDRVRPDQSDVDYRPAQVVHKKPTMDSSDISFNTPIEHFILTPRYPGRALERGIEGFVELRFDVNAMGATENIEVLRAEPKGVFEDAAIAAAERWKFQPKTENGKPVYFYGLSKLVTFEMEKG